MNATYTPSKREVLEAHYNPPGFPCYDYDICEELEAEGFLREFTSELKPNFIMRGWVLTEDGKLVVEFLRGERRALPWPASNWILIEATKPKGISESA